MPYEKLEISTRSPVLSWANHALGFEETKMAKNVASLPFVFKHGEHLTLAEILDKWMTINNYTAAQRLRGNLPLQILLFNGGYLLESRDIFKRLCNYFCLCA